MSQVSYGTITITDTTDIERIYPVYCKGGESQAPNLTPLSNWSENVSQAGGTGDYIWQRIVTKKQGIAVTAADYSDAVRLTGDDGTALTITSTQYAQTQNETDTPSYGNSMPSPINEGWWLWVKVNYSDGNSTVTKIKQGQKGDIGISVTGTKEIYFLKRTTDSVPTAPGDGVTTTSTSTAGGVWTTVVPDYVAGGVYYTSIQTSYSSGTSPKSSPAIINQGLTDANAKALDAYNTSTARDTEINAIKAQAKYYWWDSEGAHVAAGLTNIDSDSNINHLQPSSFGFNSLMSPGALKLRYKDINFAQLATNSLTFYRPATNGSTYVQGKKGMDLTADALTFYEPLAYNSSSEPTAAAQLTSNGLKISDGIIQLGTNDSSSTSNGCITLSNTDFTRLISGTSRSNLRLAIGQYFGVKNDGTLYASNADISGKITVSNDSDLSAGLGSYSTTSEMNTAIGTATNDMATKTYVGNQGYQTATDVNSIVEGKGYALNSDLTTEINQRKANYGTQSATSSDASSQTKAITCSNFELVAGNEIIIYFKYANTYSSNTVQLNINNKGAKAIWVANAVTSSTNQLLWGAGAYITFKYDGSKFIVIGEPRTWYGASTTATTTAAKTDTTAVTGCVICKGTKIELAMTYNNTAASPTLNIQSTGAKNIYYGTSTNKPTVENGHSWIADTTATFTFDGQNYRIFGQTVINGDNITTGTVDANRIKASVIQGVNNSTETSGGSALKISADKVNIEGAAIFTSGRLSETNLNNTYDEKDAAANAVNTLKTDLASASGTTIINGGHIQTDYLSAISTNIGSITAGSISRGNNSISFNQDAATLEFKNASTWTDATRGIQWTGSDLNIKGNIIATSLTLNSGVTVPAGNIGGLSPVATTGTYSSLTGTPDLTVYIAKDGTIGTEPSDSSASTSTGFKVSSAGLLKAANAVITGKIFASSGTIGGWNISTDDTKSLYYGGSSTTPTPGSGVVVLSKGLTATTSIAGSTGQQTWTITAGNKFGVTTDGTLYANGANITNINGANITGNTIAVGAMTSGAQEQILNSNIKVGGRNLVWDTEWKDVTNRWSNWGSPTTREIVTVNGKRWMHIVTTTTAFEGYSQNKSKRNNTNEVVAGDKVVCSFTAYAAVAGQEGCIGIHWLNSSGSIVNQNWTKHSFTTSEKRYVSDVFTVPDGAVSFNIMVGDNTTSAQEMWFSQVQLEFGNMATSWSPAPEDVAATATNYITTIDDGGIKVHDANDETDYVAIQSNGISIYNNNKAVADFQSNGIMLYDDTGESLASFGIDGTTIGSNTGSSNYVNLTPNGVTFFDSRKGSMFIINSESGNLNIAKTKILSYPTHHLQSNYPGSITKNVSGSFSNIQKVIPKTFRFGLVPYPLSESSSLSLNIVPVSNCTGSVTQANSVFLITITPNSTSNISNTYSYSFRIKDGTNTLMRATITIYGYNYSSSRKVSIVWSEISKADTEVQEWAIQGATSGIGNLVQVVYTTTEPAPSYTIGSRILDSSEGGYSTVIGYGLTAQYPYQTIIGKYNDNKNLGSNTGNLFEIGKGDSSTPSNALEVDGNGNLWAAGTITATGKLTAGAINNNLFVVESKTFSYDTTYGTGNQEKTTAAWTKSGYYPIGVVGFSVDQKGWVIRRCYLTSVGAGTCKVYFNIRNVLSDQYAITFTAYVLWIKITA